MFAEFGSHCKKIVWTLECITIPLLACAAFGGVFALADFLIQHPELG